MPPDRWCAAQLAVSADAASDAGLSRAEASSSDPVLQFGKLFLPREAEGLGVGSACPHHRHSLPLVPRQMFTNY